MAIFRVLFLMPLLFGSFSVSATSSERFFDAPLEPQYLESLIQKRGVYEVLAHISNDAALQETLMANIRSGNPEWLNLFIALRDHPEAEQGSMLDLHLAYALQNNPEAVLKIIHEYQLQHDIYFSENHFPHYAKLVCGNVQQDWQLGCNSGGPVGTLAPGAVDSLTKRLDALLAQEKTEYMHEKELCLAKVKSAKAFWSKLCK